MKINRIDIKTSKGDIVFNFKVKIKVKDDTDENYVNFQLDCLRKKYKRDILIVVDKCDSSEKCRIDISSKNNIEEEIVEKFKNL